MAFRGLIFIPNEGKCNVMNEDRILALPFTLSLLLICGHCIQIAWKASLTGQPVNADGAHDIAHPDCRRIFWYMLARLFGCLTLLGLSVYALSESVFRGEQMSCPEIYMFFAFLYCCVLAAVSIGIPRWRTLATRCNIVVLLTAFLVYAYRDVWPLATITEQPADIHHGKLLWLRVFVLFLTSIYIPLSVPRLHVPVYPVLQTVTETNDEQTCSWFSFLTYSFLDPVIFKANRVSHLKYDQLPPQADYDRVAYLTEVAFPYLDPFRGAKKRHIFFGLMRVFRSDYIILALMLCIQAVAEFLAPIGINRLLNYLETHGQGAVMRPWFWVCCIFSGPLVRTLAQSFYIFTSTRTLVRTEGIITQLVFEHSLRIRLEAGDQEEQGGGRKNGSNIVGKINNLATSDLYNITQGRDFLVLVLFMPLQITLGMAYLFRILGWSCFAGFFTTMLLFPVAGYVAKLVQQSQKTRMKQTDARVQGVTDAVNALRMIKLFGWEKNISNRIAEKREIELASLWRVKVLQLIGGTVAFLIPLLSMAATFGFHTIILKGELSPSKIFSSMPIFSTLRIQLNALSSLVNLVIQAKVSLDRVDEFLKETELIDVYMDAPESSPPSEDIIGFKDATFAWEEENNHNMQTPSRSFRLKIDGELLFKKGCINLIIGPTGSGKTSMLMALLGEMHFIASSDDSWSNLPRSDGVAYVAQESWVQNETIHQNILFGLPYDETRYRKVIKQCALERDLELFEAGDATEVGEKGLTLSGGQKARVTLARAIYSHAEIILVDDVLATLDVHTSTWIIEKCFKGDLVEGRTVLLVTHNVALASPLADLIVSLGTDGSINKRISESSNSGNNNQGFARARDMLELALEFPVDDRNEESLSKAHKSISDGKLIKSEETAEGHVTWRSIKLFLSGLGGNRPLVFFVLWAASLFIMEGMNTFSVWFLGFWGSKYKENHPSTVHAPFYLGVYSSMMSSTFFFGTGQLLYIHGTMRASRIINSYLVESVLRSTFRWLDETPIGRIIVRCTQDIGAVDGSIPQHYSAMNGLVVSILSKMIVIVFFTPLFLVPTLAVACLGIYIANMYLRAQMSIKREMSNARSPMLSHFSSAITGIASVRAYGAQTSFKALSLERIDRYVRIARVSNNLNRWIALRIDLLGNVFTTALAAYCVYVNSLSALGTGFSLDLANTFCIMVLSVVRHFNEFEVQANSLERIQQFIDMEQEPSPTRNAVPPASWPTSGDLRVEKLSARYSKTGPTVLQDLSFHIKSGERIGIVGRTGSGKSSLTLALLRCIYSEGKVYYDGIATDELNLDSLRSSITIIPQMPELLRGTLRHNLDPFNEHDDATLNKALQAAGLSSLQEESGEARLTLDSNISSGGSNLSVGQKQILALARAMVRGSKLLILDEATSAIDYRTDSVIQNTLRHQLPPDVTVIAVAHRLHTIMWADKIMVLDGGKIAEYDSPSKLLENAHGMLRALVNESSDKTTLYALAKEKRRSVAPYSLT